MKAIDRRIAELSKERKKMDEEAYEVMLDDKKLQSRLDKETSELVDTVYSTVKHIQDTAMKESGLFVDAMCSKGIDSLQMYPLVLSICSKENSIELVVNMAGNPNDLYISTAKSEKDILLENIVYYLAEFLLIRKDNRDLLMKGIEHEREELCLYDTIMKSKRLEEK